MGSVFSSVDETINSMIFCPPNTPKGYFDSLNTQRSCLIKLNENSNQYTPIVIVNPEQDNCTDKPNVKRKCIVFSHGNGCDIYDMYGLL